MMVVIFDIFKHYPFGRRFHTNIGIAKQPHVNNVSFSKQGDPPCDGSD
jgi:hypothetical protein